MLVNIGREATTVEAMVSGFAAGSFVFLAAHELTHSSSTSPLGAALRTFLALAGMGVMALISIWT